MEPTPSVAGTDIIIVGYSDEGPLLRSIRKCGGQYRILYIDNKEEGHFPPDGYVYVMPENIGWVKGANVGLAMSTAPYIILMNDDVEMLTPGWLEILQSAFKEEPKLACVVPVVNDPRWPRQQKREPEVPNKNWKGTGLWLPPVVPGEHSVSFFCVMFSREALVEIGYLDERFSPGYGDDDDWCSRAHLAGWKVGIHNDVLVRHQGAASFGRDGAALVARCKIQTRNRAKLAEKYGVKA